MKQSTLLITCMFCFAILLPINGQDRSIESLMKNYHELNQVQGSVLDYFTSTEIQAIQNYLRTTGTPEVSNNNLQVGTITYGFENTSLGYGSFDTDIPGDFTAISVGSGSTNFEGAGAIDPTNNTTGYMIDFMGVMYSFDVLSGVFTNLGSIVILGML